MVFLKDQFLAIAFLAMRQWYPQMLDWNKFTFYLFANDTNILYADKSLKDLETIDSQQSNSLLWKILNFVIFHPYQKRLAYQPLNTFGLLCMFDVAGEE